MEAPIASHPVGGGNVRPVIEVAKARIKNRGSLVVEGVKSVNCGI